MLVFLFTFNASGQKIGQDTSASRDKKSNGIEVYIIQEISKTNFSNISSISSGYFNKLAKKQPQTQPILSLGFGVRYTRKIRKNLK